MGRWSQVIGEHASMQCGLVTHAQLVAAGCHRDALRHLIAAGSLVRVHHRVYSIPGQPSSYERTVFAAVLAGGPHAYASHETAAQLWRLPLAGPAALEVTTRDERLPRTPGVRLHRSGLLADDLVDTVGGIPSLVRNSPSSSFRRGSRSLSSERWLTNRFDAA